MITEFSAWVYHQYPNSEIVRCNTSRYRKIALNEKFVTYNASGDFPPLGLGNVLFMLAAARSIANSLNKTFLKSITAPQIEWLSFDLNCSDYYSHELIPHQSFETIGRRFQIEFLKNNLHVFKQRRNYVVGGQNNLFSYLFLESGELRNFFYKGLRIQSPYYQIGKHVITNHKTSVRKTGGDVVCAHFRLADEYQYLRHVNGTRRSDSRFPLWCANKDFMRKGIKWFDEKLSENHSFLILSDNYSLVRSWLPPNQHMTKFPIRIAEDYYNKRGSHATHNIHSNRSLSRGDRALVEMSVLLDGCDHLLLTSGTFGWWAGWKSHGLVLMSSEVTAEPARFPLSDVFFPPNFHLLHPCVNDTDHFCEVSAPKNSSWNSWKSSYIL